MMLAAQTPAAIAGQPESVSSAALPSTTLEPCLDALKTAVGEVKVERWKGPGAIRSEAETNISSIQRDVESTLPALLAAADAAPGSTAKALPVYRNVEALYDVLLRVATAARTAAPAEQSSALDQALVGLENGRRALGDQLQKNAETEEKRADRLQAELKAVPPPVPPPPPPVPVKCPVAPVKKKKVTPAAKPGTPAISSQNPPAASH
jgi:hypothetical protein